MSAAAEPKPTPVPAEESIVKTEEGAEPQNPLTQKFTEAEWKAVKELRVRTRHISLPPRVSEPDADCTMPSLSFT